MSYQKTGEMVSAGYLSSGNSGPQNEEEATWAFKAPGLYQHGETWKYSEATEQVAFGIVPTQAA